MLNKLWQACWTSLQSDQNLCGLHVVRQLSIDICCPRPTSAAAMLSIDRTDRRADGRTDRLVTIAHAPFSTKRGMRVDRQTDRQIVALFNAPVWAGRDNRERKCADTTGTVLVHWAGHFQCENIKIFSNKIYGAILSNSTRKLLRFEITKKQLAG